MNKKYERTIEFGKVAAYGRRKNNLVELDIKLQIKEQKACFSVTGSVWNKPKTDIITGGQCLDSIWQEFEPQLKNSELFYKILLLWRKYHLNDMHAECIHQQERGEDWASSPSAICPQCGWKLGHGWNYRPIPIKDLRAIMEILEIPIMEQSTIIRLSERAK